MPRNEPWTASNDSTPFRDMTVQRIPSTCACRSRRSVVNGCIVPPGADVRTSATRSVGCSCVSMNLWRP